MPDSPVEFIVIAEAGADAELASDLADRVIREEGPEWLADFIESLRKWSGIVEETAFTAWRDLPKLSRGFGQSRYLGHQRRGQSNRYDYAAVSRTMKRLARLQVQRPITAVLFIRDLDKAEAQERKTSIEQAVADNSFPKLTVVLGFENPNREAWVLNGFKPETDDERETLQQLRQKLGFDPCEHAERLTATQRQAKRNAKRVLGLLLASDYERQRSCWAQTPLSDLRARGEGTGLKSFLHNAEDLIPLLAEMR